MRRRTMLGVWAHPDDEAYMSAGLMASFRRRGDRVVIVTATLGELGTDDPRVWPPHRLGAERLRELRNSLAVVDVDELHVLGFPDGGCESLDGTDAIGQHILDVEPDLIVTFGPDGMTGHPDHRAVSRWTTKARDALRSDAELWYATVTADFHAAWGSVNDAVGFFEYQTQLPCTDARWLAHHETLADDLLDLKFAALAAHRTQTQRFIDQLGPSTYRQWWRTESFRSAYQLPHTRKVHTHAHSHARDRRHGALQASRAKI